MVIFFKIKFIFVLFIYLNRFEVFVDLEYFVWIVIGKNSEISYRIYFNVFLKILVNNIEIFVIKFEILDFICNSYFMCFYCKFNFGLLYCLFNVL